MLAHVLCFVIVFNISSTFNHSHPHTHALSESTCNEIDACHKFIFHHQKSESCNGSHKHVQEKQEECYSCKYLKQGYENFYTAFSLKTPAIFEANNVFYYRDYQFIPDFTHFYLRGPPIAC